MCFAPMVSKIAHYTHKDSVPAPTFNLVLGATKLTRPLVTETKMNHGNGRMTQDGRGSSRRGKEGGLGTVLKIKCKICKENSACFYLFPLPCPTGS